MAEQVLVFTLGDTRYCVSINSINEIVEKGELTQVPNAASHVRGVMDLRGETTTLIDPKQILDTGGENDGDRVVIFDGWDGRSVGWLVDRVHEVAEVNDADIESVSDREAVRGVIRTEDRFIIWLNPTPVNAGTESAEPAA